LNGNFLVQNSKEDKEGDPKFGFSTLALA